MPFSPASLFSGGVQGGWYDPSDLSTLFQDTAGTVPVTAVGQSVALMKDKSGNGNDLSQATASQCPTYQVDDSGHAYLTFSSVGDGVLRSSTAVALSQPSFIAAAFSKYGDGSGVLFRLSNGNTSFLDLTNIATASRIASRTRYNVGTVFQATSPVSAMPASTVKVLDGYASDTAVDLFINGVATTSVANVAHSFADSCTFSVGNITEKFYGGLIVLKAITAAERVNIQGYLGSKSGVSGLGPAVGTSSGTSAASGVGKGKAKGTGSAFGTASTSGIGKALAKGIGTTSGTSTASGVGKAVAAGIGLAAGVAIATGVGAALSVGVGLAAGVATVMGVGKWLSSSLDPNSEITVDLNSTRNINLPAGQIITIADTRIEAILPSRITAGG